MLKEELLCTSPSEKTNVIDLVSRIRERARKACTFAKEALSLSQMKMKRCYDQKAVVRNFLPGEKVLVLIPAPGSAFTARFSGPYVIQSKVATEARERVSLLTHILPTQDSDDGLNVSMEVLSGGCLKNSEALLTLPSQLSYLSTEQQQDIQKFLKSFPNLFNDVPPGTSVITHDINVGSTLPIKQHAYRCPVSKREAMKHEVTYLLENGFAVPSSSPWSSPCVLVPKADGSFRFCTDFRKVNSITVPDAFPLPRIDDCIDSLGTAKYITKLDLLKGYWQVPLTERASEISAFVTPDSFLQYTRMAFGLRNAPATFQRLMSLVLVLLFSLLQRYPVRFNWRLMLVPLEGELSFYRRVELRPVTPVACLVSAELDMRGNQDGVASLCFQRVFRTVNSWLG
ncbi:Transposon Ty3-I Gag-Pol polyprotein [Labeo rohita]|uniref:ribonuclease H n=1 Tax=Labeo rohita TaxID=84645 RepID=A0ABQ8LDF5_LABRO|nr:Transposon Ty3-I Gag-Pol polyprotein [Labeo rohita]